MKYLFPYLLIINAAGFVFMLADKVKAKRGSWRIPEATLLTLAALGGSLGAVMGMQLLRHKTKHLKFSLGLPLLLALHIILLILLIPKLL